MAEEIEISLPFRGRNAVYRKPPNKFDKQKSMVVPNSSSSASAMLHALESMNEMERNKLIQSIENLSWTQTWDLTKQFDKQRREKMPAQQPLFGMENESHSCPEMLPAARDGPGVDLNSSVYELLAKPRTVEGVEEPEPWATADPPDFIPNDGYEEIGKTVKCSNNVEFRTQRDARHKIQVKAYTKSRRIFPIVQNDILTFTSEYHNSGHEPESDWTLDIQEGDDLWHELKHRISSFDLPNRTVRNQFRSWWDQLPAGHQVDIYHVAFFDGTAMPDGQSSMFLPDTKHIPTPRNMKDELTRLHWHETSEGYVYNLGKINKKRKKKELEQQEHLRRTADYRAWLELPPDSKIVPPGIYLRPAEQCDASSILEIMNWYAQNSALSSETRSMEANDIGELLQFCRDNHFPFVVAARRPPERLCRNQIDPVVGYAYVEFHRHGKSADKHMGELHVFVQEGSKKQHIGRALVDMVLSCFDVTSGKSKDYEFDQTGTVQYRAGYGRPLTAIVCAIATSPEAQEEHDWIKKWLEREFGFQEKCVFENARVKSGKSYDLRYMARPMGAPHLSNGVKGQPQVQAHPQGSSTQSTILNYL
ncbi:Acyl-CoA N-acyltransferase [Penicillium expansum]|uniref:Acyl-CoA N-acyltransferase n=1 Tax=Penicillium expansum TaxID=27334 RepID=A0A0A2KB78_PENEN|nr:Acyl-CoA N-acyltransferase [Penicillium expansum]KGO54296.1 Acyl-CoA N-acyltransferase [Penicillium expansum]KGO65082.1 Acyl-CoA N-acyltransferase [Penicillium expansum]